jgi:hypothetical protein
MSRDQIESLPPVVAAGVAARAALSLHHTRKSSASSEIENEALLRAQLIQHVRDEQQLGDDTSESTLERIAHALYEYSDSLLNRLEEAVASIFTVDVDTNKSLILSRRIRRENKIISKTISYPTKVYQIYTGQRSGVIQYQCVYVREVEGEFPFYEFVIAKKAGRTVHVQSVLRLYPNVNGRITLPDGQINLLLRALREGLTIDALAEVLQTQFPSSTIIVIYSCHWVFAYFTGGEVNPLRSLEVILGDGFLPGFESVTN